MKKRLIAIATLAALPAMSFAADDAKVSGFVDITYVNNNDTSAFGATAEVDYIKTKDKVTVRVDTDLNLTGESATIEQAFFAFAATKTVTVIGGVFNNPIGLEKEDAPDMPATTKGQVWGILDGQTALNGNNIAGVAVAAAVGPATITAAALNDIGDNNGNENNSFALVANVTPMKGLDLELGYVTQEANDAVTAPTSAGNVLDINAVYSVAGATVSFEYLKADAAVDSAMEIGLGYAITNKINGYFRYDVVAYEADGVEDDTSITVYGSYALAPNLLVAAEYYSKTVGDADADQVVGLEFIATF